MYDIFEYFFFSHSKLMKRQALSKKCSLNGLKKMSVALSGTTPITTIALAGTEPITTKTTTSSGSSLLNKAQSGSNTTSTTAITTLTPSVISPGGTVLIHDFSGDSSVDSLSAQVDSTTEIPGMHQSVTILKYKYYAFNLTDGLLRCLD